MSVAFQPSPIPWSDFPAECFWYVYPFMGVLHLAIFAIGSVVVVRFSRTEPDLVGTRIVRFGLFVILLLFVGALFNGAWSCLIWDRLYDSTDYVFDFSPFWPITRSTIDAPFGLERGRLLGVSLFQLQLVWLLFAAGTWAVAVYLYRTIARRQASFTSEEPTPVLR